MSEHLEAQDIEPRGRASQSRQAAGEAVAAVGSAIAAGEKRGWLSKIALARAAFTLVRRYPVAALCIGGLTLAVLLASSRRAKARTYLH
jgi:hypothetical protein